MVAILKYKKITIYHSIYIKGFFYGTVFYLAFCTDDVLKTTNNVTAFTELTRVLKKLLRLKSKKDLS